MDDAGSIRAAVVEQTPLAGAFIELEPGVEALAHVSTFAPTGRTHGWKELVPPGTTAAFEILGIDREKKRIGVALVPEGSSREAAATRPSNQEAEDLREYSERAEGAAPERFGSLADKLKGALGQRKA